MNPTSREETYRNQPLAGALFVLSASLTFAALGALIKVVSTSLSNEMVVFFRNLCALILHPSMDLVQTSYRRSQNRVLSAPLAAQLGGAWGNVLFFLYNRSLAAFRSLPARFYRSSVHSGGCIPVDS